MNGTSCDEYFTGYRLGQLISCNQCGSESCDSCIKNHKALNE